MSDTSHLQVLVDILKREVSEKGYLDVGNGFENTLPVSRNELNAILSQLKQEGYSVRTMRLRHVTDPTLNCTYEVLVASGVDSKDIFLNRRNIQLPNTTP